MSISGSTMTSMVIAGGLAGLAGAQPARRLPRLSPSFSPGTASTASPWRCWAAPSARRGRCRLPVRGAAGGRTPMQAAPDPDRPHRHHPGAGHHLHRRAGPGPRHLPDPGGADDRTESSPRGGARDRRRRPPCRSPGPAESARGSGSWASSTCSSPGDGPRRRLERGARRRVDLPLTPATARITLPNLVVPAAMTIYVLAAVVAFVGRGQLTRGFGARWAIILGLVAFAFVFAFLAWAAAGKSFTLTGMLQTTVLRAVPIAFGGLSGVLCERAGVVNIAIEGMLLSGAFTGRRGQHHRQPVARDRVGRARRRRCSGCSWRCWRSATASTRSSPASRSTSSRSALRASLGPDAPDELGRAEHARTPRADPDPVPLRHPVLGPMLFQQNIFVYALFVLIALTHYGLFYTRWGLRARAVGEHPRRPTRSASTSSGCATSTSSSAAWWPASAAPTSRSARPAPSTRDDRRPRLHRPGRHDLRRLAPDRRVPRGLVFGFADSLQARLSILRSRSRPSSC